MPPTDVEVLEGWAASGAMDLTGRAGQPPLGPPAPLIPRFRQLACGLTTRAERHRRPLGFDPMQLLGERAAVSRLSRHGDASCGGTTRLLRCADGWIAVSLARDEDAAAVPAWLESPTVHGSVPREQLWDGVTSVIRRRPSSDVVVRARLLGIPAAPMGHQRRGAEGPMPPPSAGSTSAALAPTAGAPFPPVSVITVGNADIRNPHDGASGGDLGRLLVVDLSSLWAGPLCSHLLQQLGLRVVKVESTRRPDGARGGHRGFFDLLNGGKRSVALDFHADHDVALLRRLLSVADIVIEASRPRALEQLGIVATDLLAHGPRVWVSITGYGRSSPGRDWVAFGDDAAVAGGLVVRDPSGPCFCADAIADPLTGLTAALAALDALDTGRRVLLDIAMARVAGHFAGPTLPVTGDLRPSAPVARPVVQRGPELGEHNDIVLGPLRRRR